MLQLLRWYMWSNTSECRARRSRAAVALVPALLVVLSGSAEAQSGLTAPEPIGAFLDGVFPSSVPGSTPGGSWATRNALPNLSFPEPVRIVEHPRADQLAIVSKTGPIWLVDDDPAATDKTLLLDLSGLTNYPSVGEGGVSGFAFHPDFGEPTSPNRGYVYVHYRHTPGVSGQTGPGQIGYNRLSRFSVPDGEIAADLASELVLIDQYDRQQWHIGGDMFFGADGFLYLAVGDEGNCCARTDSTQRIDGGLWSGILRIDVDNDPARSHPICRQPREAAEIASAGNSANEPRPAAWPHSSTQGYSIPDDNPFVDPDYDPATDPECDGLEEFYAIGLRHPWTFSRDPATNRIWYADVGQNTREEVGRIEAGDNHQWAYREGTDVNGPIAEPAGLVGDERLPVADYTRSGGAAVIGAGVYRGDLYPELRGRYLFADFIHGDFWALDADAEGPLQIRSQDDFPAPGVERFMSLPGGFSDGINSFAMPRDGRILMAKTAGGSSAGGTILELVRQGTPTEQPPQLLSQTGFFTDLAGLSVRSGCIPFDLNVPFWSDDALKSRWLCLPNDGTHDSAEERIGYSEQGDWTFPVGTVLVKHFELGIDALDPSLTRRLETRFLVQATNGWYGVTYRWNAAASDAELLYDGLHEDVEILAADGSTTVQDWYYPSRGECRTCHGELAGGALGPVTRQLNRDLTYPSTGITANQLVTFDALGMLDPSLADPAAVGGLLTSTPTADAQAPIADRARSYLDANCGYCHRPGGVRSEFDARLTTPLQSSGLLFGALSESLGLPGEAVIVPGHPERSVAYLRASSAGESISMPPLAKSLVDDPGMQVLAAFIESLQVGLGNDTTSDGSFIDSHHPSLYIDETDTFTNGEAVPVTVTLGGFRFYARREGNPVTPIAVRVEGDDDFTVLAVGTTRTPAEYDPGENAFAFDDDTTRTLLVQPGETLAAGWMDAFPDGSGWGAGSVIPADSGSGQDEVWALLPSPLILQVDPFDPDHDVPAVVEGENPLVTNAGKALQTLSHLERSYRFAVDLQLGDGSASAPIVDLPPVLVHPGDQSSRVGDGVSLQISGSDPEGETLVFSASGLPDGLSISSAGLVGGSPTGAGIFPVTVTASDGTSAPASVLFSWSVTEPGGGISFALGNDPTTAGADADAWSSNLVVGEDDRYTNPTGAVQQVRVTGFDFYSHAEAADPVTPFVVKVNGDDDFTVVAIGTTRDAAEYALGANSFPFAEGAAPGISLQPGETLAPGFLDALPDGSGGGAGSVVSGDFSTGDEIWYSGGPAGADSGRVALGAAPTPGSQTIGTLRRNYRFRIRFEATGEEPTPPEDLPPTLENPGDQLSTLSVPVALQLAGSDPEGAALAYSASGLPDGLTLDAATGLVSGAPTRAGGFFVVALADDGTNLPASAMFGWSVSAPGGSSVAIGNPDGTGVQLDTWASNLYVNESDTYTNPGPLRQVVRIDDFGFEAGVAGRDPVTPFVVLVNGPHDFTVAAIGDPRSDYAAGSNHYPFADGAAPTILLLPGETLASGFMDALPDGGGGGLGNPIPKTSDDDPVNGDALWYTGGPDASHAGSIALGQPPAPSPTPGTTVQPNLQREYRYSIGMTVSASQVAAPVPIAPWVGAALAALLGAWGRWGLRSGSASRH